MEQVDPSELTRLDACWSVAEGLALVDNIRAAALRSLHLLLALKAGEPNRIARALAVEAGFLATTGAFGPATHLLARAERLASSVESEYVRALCRATSVVMAYHDGRFKEAAALAVAAERLLTEQATGVQWWLTLARLYRIGSLGSLGDVNELVETSQRCLKDARQRGNVFSTTLLLTGWSSLSWLVPDDVAGARQALAEALTKRRQNFHIPDFYCMLARGFIDLYAEDASALHHVNETWPSLVKSKVLRVKTLLVHGLSLRGRCALATSRFDENRSRVLSRAERDARRIERLGLPWATAMAGLLHAGVACRRTQRDKALNYLERVIESFDSWRHAPLARCG